MTTNKKMSVEDKTQRVFSRVTRIHTLTLNGFKGTANELSREAKVDSGFISYLLGKGLITKVAHVISWNTRVPLQYNPIAITCFNEFYALKTKDARNITTKVETTKRAYKTRVKTPVENTSSKRNIKFGWGLFEYSW